MNIENKKQLATLLLAAGLGLLTAFLLSQYIQNNIKAERLALEQKYERASKEQRERLLQEMGMMQQDFNGKLAQLAKEQQIQQEKIKKAQADLAEAKKAVVVKREAKPPSVKAFSLTTPPGKRAFTISIDSLNAVGGLIKSGDRVDVISQLMIPDQGDVEDAEDAEVTTVLFQDVEVLAVGTKYGDPATATIYATQQKSKTLRVTLALDPEEAALLAFAEDFGELRLSLRGPSRDGRKILDVASWDSLSDYLLDSQGTNLTIPVTKKIEVEEERIEPGKKIQVFKSGQETSF